MLIWLNRSTDDFFSGAQFDVWKKKLELSVDIGNSQLTGWDALAQMNVLNFDFGTRNT